MLALAFLGAGGVKVLRSKPALQSIGMTWVNGFPAGAVKLIGAAEVIGALGLILPLLTNIAPVLTPIAAAALAVLMVGGIIVHMRLDEPFVPTIVLAILSIISAVLGFMVIAS
nr:DoxX family protein [Microbacterium endophyticum]